MKTTFTAVLYLPGKPARTLPPDQVHALRIGDLSMPGPVPCYHLCHGAPRRVDRWLGLAPHPKRLCAWHETLASGPRYVAYAWPNAADSDCPPNPEATARLRTVAGLALDEDLVGPILLITA